MWAIPVTRVSDVLKGGKALSKLTPPFHVNTVVTAMVWAALHEQDVCQANQKSTRNIVSPFLYKHPEKVKEKVFPAKLSLVVVFSVSL